MADTGNRIRTLFGNLARLGAGLIMVAAAAASALESRQRRPKPDRQAGTGLLALLLRGSTPRGPLPMQGGAAARLECGRDDFGRN